MMTSRQRLMTALDHREPDRVLIDLNGTLVTALTRTADSSSLGSSAKWRLGLYSSRKSYSSISLKNLCTWFSVKSLRFGKEKSRKEIFPSQSRPNLHFAELHFFPSHNIQADVSLDRIGRMFRTVIENRDCRTRPITTGSRPETRS